MKKYYRIIKSDLCIAGKIYKEGSTVDFIDESLKEYFEPIPEDSSNIDPPALSFRPANWRGEISSATSSDSANNLDPSFRPEGEILNATSSDSANKVPIISETPSNNNEEVSIHVIEQPTVSGDPIPVEQIKPSPKKGRPKKIKGDS
ncbi:MAG: hypothetical protein ACYCVH_10680 [Ignavibacteriaceae bacterium]